MERLLFAVALAFAAAAQAFAADLPPAPPPPQAPVAYIPPVAAVYNWGGIYFGANAGYGFGTSSWSDPNNFSGLGSTGNFDLSGAVVGATLGVNFQWDAFVAGIEGDLDASWIDGKTSSAFCGASIGFAGSQCETRNNWFGTARGRVGYAADRVLFYGTAGGAFGNVAAGGNGGLLSSNKAGWTAGAGIEAAFSDNWTARIEYLFVDLGSATCGTANPCGNDVLGPASQTVKFDTNLVRVGVDYKFR
jgi:outer membrane immunogenic protein